MPSWTHLVRFIAVEDSQIHLGQLVDTTRDVGRDSVNGVEIPVYVIDGTIFDGRVTKEVMHVKQLLSPISRDDCNYIRCLGLNYVDHAKEASLVLPKAPILFTKPRTALSGPSPETINIPKCAQDGTSDYEAELCVVVGKTGRDISEEDALDYVLGYTASNDVSARTMQLLTTQWCFSKGLDGSCPIGPVLVSPDVIQDPQTLPIKAIHNGITVQDGHTKDMIFSIRKQISYLSQGTTLEAGTIFLTGTPAGIGFFHNPRVVLNDGDEMSVEIGQIGTLVNKVRYEKVKGRERGESTWMLILRHTPNRQPLIESLPFPRADITPHSLQLGPPDSDLSSIRPAMTELRIGVVLFPGFQALDVFGPLDCLNVLSRTHPLTLSLLSSTLDPISTKPPLSPCAISQSILPTHTFTTAPDLDVLLVPGGLGSRGSSPVILDAIDYIKTVYPSLKYLITVCTGSGLAARAGILDGRKATTNKMAWREMAALRSEVDWVAKARWVVDGNIWTSSGVSAGIDVTLAWIESVYGEQVAETIANGIEYTRHQDAGEDPFAELYGLSS